MKNRRNSSIELLRIICMIGIIMHHFSVHGDFEIISSDNFSFNLVLVQIFSIYGKMACNIFILITGYFMIKSDFNIKKFILLIVEMTFYSLTISIIFYFINPENVNIIDIVKSIFSVFYGNWFLVNYLIIYVLTPYINKMILSLDKINFKKFIYILIIVFSIIPTFAINCKYEFNNFDIMIIMYIIGAYIRLYSENKKDKKYLYGMLLFNGMLLLSVIFFDIVGLILNKNGIIKNATYFSKINSIITVGGAILTFLYFLNNINFNSKIINFFSSTTLGIYLIHDNKFVREFIWIDVFPNNEYINEQYFIWFIILKVLLIFLICSGIDKIRYYLIEKNIKKYILDKKIEEI